VEISASKVGFRIRIEPRMSTHSENTNAEPEGVISRYIIKSSNMGLLMADFLGEYFMLSLCHIHNINRPQIEDVVSARFPAFFRETTQNTSVL
jgi:hypothetical protein